MKKYVEIEATRDENIICLETGYSLGGHNWYNGANEQRGYYLYCTPMQVAKRDDGRGNEYETYTQVLGKGNKILLKQVARQSQKAEMEAEKIAEEKAGWLLEQVCEIYGLKLKEDACEH